MTKKTFSPEHWETQWSDKAIAIIKPIMLEIKSQFDDVGFNAFFTLVCPGFCKGRTFVGLAIQKQNKPQDKTPNLILGAFGFFYEDAARWKDDYIENMIAPAIEQYHMFASGNTRIPGIHGNRNFRSGFEVPSSVRGAIEPAVAAKKTDMWGEEVEEEDDPLS